MWKLLIATGMTWLGAAMKANYDVMITAGRVASGFDVQY
jgi:hypothetical protein